MKTPCTELGMTVSKETACSVSTLSITQVKTHVTIKRMVTHILYLPGLNDKYDPLRRFFLRFWLLLGVSATHVPMKWEDRASYQEKLAHLNQAIDDAKGSRIVLIGESAGGSMVLNAYALRPNDLYKVMTICGKNTKADAVSPYLYQKHSAFKTSMYRAELSVEQLTKSQREAFVSIYPIVDRVVPIEEMFIPDCQQVRLWSFGHSATVLFALSLASWYIVYLAKR